MQMQKEEKKQWKCKFRQRIEELQIQAKNSRKRPYILWQLYFYIILDIIEIMYYLFKLLKIRIYNFF